MAALNRRRQPNRRPLEAPTPDLLAWAAERLGPKPGRWAGWADPIEGNTREAWTRVGYIHGMSAETGRGLQAIGQTLQQLRAELSPEQFGACVAAEFGWPLPWALLLIEVAQQLEHTTAAQGLELLQRAAAGEPQP
jgi:hypothetical protein